MVQHRLGSAAQHITGSSRRNQTLCATHHHTASINCCWAISCSRRWWWWCAASVRKNDRQLAVCRRFIDLHRLYCSWHRTRPSICEAAVRFPAATVIVVGTDTHIHITHHRHWHHHHRHCGIDLAQCRTSLTSLNALLLSVSSSCFNLNNNDNGNHFTALHRNHCAAPPRFLSLDILGSVLSTTIRTASDTRTIPIGHSNDDDIYKRSAEDDAHQKSFCCCFSCLISLLPRLPSSFVCPPCLPVLLSNLIFKCA